LLFRACNWFVENGYPSKNPELIKILNNTLRFVKDEFSKEKENLKQQKEAEVRIKAKEEEDRRNTLDIGKFLNDLEIKDSLNKLQKQQKEDDVI